MTVGASTPLSINTKHPARHDIIQSMIKHKRSGFTVVELLIIIVVIAMLVTIAAVSYRNTQATAADKKRIADAMVLKSAVEEYYADNGAYPSPGCNECWGNEVWQMLIDQGYLAKTLIPEAKSEVLARNIAPGGGMYYGWVRSTTSASFAIFVPLKSTPSPVTACKMGTKMTPTWWSSAPDCDSISL